MVTIDLKLKSYDELQFEIMRLNTDNYLKQQQIQELTNNWNELEEWLKSVVEYETLHKGNYMTVRGEWGQEVLDKMKEIKEGNNALHKD